MRLTSSCRTKTQSAAAVYWMGAASTVLWAAWRQDKREGFSRGGYSLIVPGGKLPLQSL